MSPKDIDHAIELRDILLRLATGGEIDETLYRELRSRFLHRAATSKLVPKFVRSNLDKSGLWQAFKEIHTGSGAYAARRRFVEESFTPLFQFLEAAPTFTSERVTSVITDFDAQGIQKAWQKSLERMKTDPEGAITSSRTLLEEVCKHILEDSQTDYEEKWDLPKLYGACSKILRLAPSQHTEDSFKRILGSCHTIVETLGEIRNKIGDAHGGGRRRVRPSERHAAFVVNIAGTTAMFLLETYIERQKEISEEIAEGAERGRIISEIKLSSRKGIEGEVLLMQRAINTLPLEALRRIEYFYCDSKSTTYEVMVKDGMWDDDLPSLINESLLRVSSGHNGIYFQGDAPPDSALDPDWLGDRLEDSDT